MWPRAQRNVALGSCMGTLGDGEGDGSGSRGGHGSHGKGSGEVGRGPSQSWAAGMPALIPAAAATTRPHTPSSELPWLHAGLTWTVSVPFSLASGVLPPPNRLEMVLPSSRRKKAQRLKATTAATPPPRPRAGPACLPKMHTGVSSLGHTFTQAHTLILLVRVDSSSGLSSTNVSNTDSTWKRVHGKKTHVLTYLIATIVPPQWVSPHTHPCDLQQCRSVPSPAP